MQLFCSCSVSSKQLVAMCKGMEGPDDMPAHIRTIVTDSGLTIPVRDGRLVLGTWQGIYLIEHRDRAHRREIALHAVGA